MEALEGKDPETEKLFLKTLIRRTLLPKEDKDSIQWSYYEKDVRTKEKRNWVTLIQAKEMNYKWYIQLHRTKLGKIQLVMRKQQFSDLHEKILILKQSKLPVIWIFDSNLKMLKSLYSSIENYQKILIQRRKVEEKKKELEKRQEEANKILKLREQATRDIVESEWHI